MATHKPTPDPWDFETLLIIDKRIDTSEADSIRDRWEFGRLMLAARDGRKRLPNGYLAQLVQRTGKSRRELGYRVQFAETYPTEAELCNALHSLTSWHDVVENMAVAAAVQSSEHWTAAELAELVRLDKRIDELDTELAERMGTSVEQVRALMQIAMGKLIADSNNEDGE